MLCRGVVWLLLCLLCVRRCAVLVGLTECGSKTRSIGTEVGSAITLSSAAHHNMHSRREESGVSEQVQCKLLIRCMMLVHNVVDCVGQPERGHRLIHLPFLDSATVALGTAELSTTPSLTRQRTAENRWQHVDRPYWPTDEPRHSHNRERLSNGRSASDQPTIALICAVIVPLPCATRCPLRSVAPLCCTQWDKRSRLPHNYQWAGPPAPALDSLARRVLGLMCVSAARLSYPFKQCECVAERDGVAVDVCHGGVAQKPFVERRT